MGRYILGRFLFAIVTLLAMSVIVFGLARITGDPSNHLLPVDATPEMRMRIRELWGLDQPLHRQYLSFVQNAVTGNFGESLRWPGRNAIDLVFEKIRASLELAGIALVFSLAISVPIGVLSAAYKDSRLDAAGKAIAILGQAVPHFWLAIVMMWVFGVRLRWFPTSGRGTFAHLILPAVVIGWFHTAAMMRLIRSSMLEALESEYVKLARVKGTSERKVIWKHALRNSVIVPLTYFGIMIGHLMIGSVAIETVFSWPGAGQLVIQAIGSRDFPVVQAVVLVFATVFIAANFVVDVLYGYLDPRIRYERNLA